MARIEELEYLRRFYTLVDSALGCASDDIYFMIHEEILEETGLEGPEGYLDEDDE